ncbi:MAG: hypothetical protein LQ337_003697 [Flavoplaca oasis]|nr:MAG: hypothetical protein LQ337_003697 [Flavoplaca oasis]
MPESKDNNEISLPGVINIAEVAEEEYLVTLVRNLVMSYIKDDSCINLLALPMTDDPANSTASKLVQEANAQARTIGVLTKPDRVQTGESIGQWRDVLDGSKFRIGHGYYVIKNNPNPEVNNLVARQEEDQFFEQEPWVHTFSTFGDRFGTPKLSSKLSKLLNTHIKTSLPQITEQVRLKTAEINTRLRELPEPPEGNLGLKIFEKILHFEQDLRCHLDGGSADYPFKKEFHAAASRFRETIRFSFPRLSLRDVFTTFNSSSRLPYRPSTTPTPSDNCRHIIPIDSDGEYEPTAKSTQTSTPMKRKIPVTTSAQSTPKRSRLDDVPQYTPSKDNAASSSFTSYVDLDRTAPFAKRFTVMEIRAILQDAHIGLPGQVDPRATERMIKESLSHWDKPLDELLEFTGQTCHDMIIQRASAVFGQWQGTRCYETLLEICSSFFQEQLQKQIESAKRVLAIERHATLTLNEEAMKSASEMALMTLETRCREERVKAFLKHQDNDWDYNLSERQKTDRMSKITDIQLGPNPYSIELRAIADVRGYYDCAYSQFVDAIYKGIRAELLITCRNEIGNALKQGIGLEEKDAEQRCAVLLAVNPENERLRAELIKQKSNLEKASEWLESQ